MASNNASYTFTTTSRLNNFDEDPLLINEIDETRSRCIFGKYILLNDFEKKYLVWCYK